MSENDGTQVPETVTVPKEQYDEIVVKLADKTQATSNLVAEVKELREKNQITEAEAAALREKLASRPDTATTEVNPQQVAEVAADAVKKVLNERDNQTAKENKDAAFAAFLEKHPEFAPANDEGGIKLSILEGKLARFNLAGLKSQSDFMTIFEDARNLAVGNTSAPIGTNEDPNPIAPNGGGGSSTVRESEDNALSPKELKLIQDTFAGDKERYLKQKAKRPDYVATLLAYLS